MNNVIIFVGSVTYAIKLKKLFLREGLPSRLVKTNNPNLGCTHGLEISERDLYQAVAIMKSRQIEYYISNDTK